MPSLAAARRALAGGGRIVLPYASLYIQTGDSQAQATPSAADIAAFKASYVVTPQVQVLNYAGQWVPYDPNNNLSGVNIYNGNVGNVGFEAGFIAKFVARYASPLYIIKQSAPGSYQTRGLSNGSVTGAISGDNLTVSSGTPGNNFLIVGGSLPTGIYLPFVNSGSVWYARKLGTTATPGLGSLASATYTTFVTTNSWSVTEGSLYLGANNSIINQTRGKIAAAIAALTAAGISPRIVTWFHTVGTNDMSDPTLAGNFQGALTDFYARIASDFDLSNAQIIAPQVMNTVANSPTVRSAQAAVVAGDPARRKLINMDGRALATDNTHWTGASVMAGGGDAFALTTFGP